MTRQLLILGNGFDLHCGLKSSYKDFFRSEIFYSANESFGLKLLQPGVSGFWESLLLEYYKLYGKQDFNWCDIETIIKETLFYVFMPQSKGKIEESTDKTDKIAYFLNDYIANFYGRLPIQPNLRYKIPILVEKELFYHLLQQLYNLEKRFCKFLKNQIINPDNHKEINTDYIVKAVNLLAKLTGFSEPYYKDLGDIMEVEEVSPWELMSYGYPISESKEKKVLHEDFNNLTNTNILNFNYTALFDILGVNSPCVYSNVHGKLCNNNCTKDCNESNVIFGIDDNLIQSQDLSSDLRLFSKTYRKMLVAGEPTNILPLKAAKSLEIKFFGHSLSEADYSYFQSIFDYYDLYGNSNVSLTFYYSKGFENYDAVYNLISSYGKSFDNKEKGKNLIHKLLLENRLKIVEID